MTFSCNYEAPVSVRRYGQQRQEILLINERYQHFLQGIGFTSFAAAWTFARGEIIKEKGERTVIRAEFPCPADPEVEHGHGPEENTVFYIKKHCQRLSLWQRLQCLLRPLVSCGEGFKEFHNYCRFRQNGLATAVPVAAGIKFSSFLRADSFLITQDFSPLTALEDIVLQQPATLLGRENQQKKNNILRAVGRYARRMHDSGMNQKDFNATHILLQNLVSEQPQVALFDLQRVDHNPLNRLRWPIKALAELNYTLPPVLFSESDRLLLFSAYKGKKNLSALDQWQYLLIRRKTARIARHTQKRGLAPKMTDTE
ncbi:MAG: lipopolysaccharide kinase InaA family protein [Proteobacteria bacterium]|nr:lipopolysaccharide kinase InaA family protein [Pseudomonadota bacterium]MBU4294846.1 lipopolysaccharide kinase InaA family protein [Pseudomonadota bacterium]MCG2749348.1 lipopolysaccharide kinase InaA family protein [Desulfobulbaceae bacterium]